MPSCACNAEAIASSETPVSGSIRVNVIFVSLLIPGRKALGSGLAANGLMQQGVDKRRSVGIVPAQADTPFRDPTGMSPLLANFSSIVLVPVACFRPQPCFSHPYSLILRRLVIYMSDLKNVSSRKSLSGTAIS
jgi:hypothetical protein